MVSNTPKYRQLITGLHLQKIQRLEQKFPPVLNSSTPAHHSTEITPTALLNYFDRVMLVRHRKTKNVNSCIATKPYPVTSTNTKSFATIPL
jgi:hypothetical protein